MKKAKRALGLLLTVALLAPGVLPSSAANNNGSYIRRVALAAGDNLTYTSGTLMHSEYGREEERIFELSYPTGIIPVVVSGDKVYKSQLSLEAAAEKLKNQGYRVVGGITGGMFSTANGVPIGVRIEDGILKTADYGLPAIGFFADGSAEIGTPSIQLSVTASPGTEQAATIKIDRLNLTRDVGKVYLYTHHFSTTTQTTLEGVHVIVTVDGELRLGQPLNGVVKEIVSGKMAYTLAPGEVVLSANSEEPISRLAPLKAGTAVTINATTPNTRWNLVRYACSGTNSLVRSGTQVSGLNSTDKAPRTAVGVKADGSIICYAVDGRQSGYSNGMSLAGLAGRLISQGCVEAIELDGGGSTTFGMIYPGTNEFKIMNSPSDGSQRKCSDYIFFVNPTAPTGELSYLFPREAQITMLPRATYSFTQTAADSNWHPMTPPSASSSYWWSERPEIAEVLEGSITAVGSGRTDIYTEYGWAYGVAEAIVVDTVDKVEIYRESDLKNTVSGIKAAPSEIISLTAKALKDSFQVVSGDQCFTWSTEGGIGEISPDGTFTAAGEIGLSGRIIVSGAGHTVSVSVSVGQTPSVVEAFEDAAYKAPEAADTKFYIDTFTKRAARGLSSARLSYSIPEGQLSAVQPMEIPLAGKPGYLFMYVKGDGSNNTLSVEVSDASGRRHMLEFCNLSNTAYQRYKAKLPQDAAAITGFKISGETRNGTLSLDHIVAAWEDKASSTPPAVGIVSSVSGGGVVDITATVRDGGGFYLAKEQISVVFDGEPVEFTYKPDSGLCYITVPERDNGMSLLTIYAEDAFGNRKKESKQFNYPRAEGLDMLYDMADSWAAGYADFLDVRNVFNVRESFGVRYFDPDQELTRLEMVEMFLRLMGVDPEDYKNEDVPFADIGEIPEEKKSSIKAAYVLGLLSGTVNANGTLRSAWNEPITKQDFCVIGSGVLPKGYAGKALAFTDSESVSGYAREAVEIFVNQGIILGNERNEFKPKKAISKAEAAVILTKLFF